MAKTLRVAMIPGDGIGREVAAEAARVMRAAADVYGTAIELVELPYGAEHFLRSGETLPAGECDRLARECDAIFVGALGDPRVPDNRHAREILLGLRFQLDLYVNQRPIRLLDPRLCPLKDPGAAALDLVVFRENTEGLYVGVGGRFKAGTDDEVAVQEEINTFKGVDRIVRHAFTYARQRGLRRVCMADKSNAMADGHALWQRVFRAVAREHGDIEATHLYIDALALQMIRDPTQFQVIVTNNLFGDIVTDIGAALQGGLGFAASGNLHPGRTSMFEPVHGSAPPLAGKNVANPVGAILSAALMLEFLGRPDEASAIERAAREAVRAREVTADGGGSLGTRETGEGIARRIRAGGTGNADRMAGNG